MLQAKIEGNNNTVCNSPRTEAKHTFRNMGYKDIVQLIFIHNRLGQLLMLLVKNIVFMHTAYYIYIYIYI
jgi:hypothetical protein